MPQNRYTGSYGNRSRSDDEWRGSERGNRSRYSSPEDRNDDSASRSYRDQDGSSRASRNSQSSDRDSLDRHNPSRYDGDRYGEDVSRSRLESRGAQSQGGYDDDQQRSYRTAGSDDRDERSRYGGRNDWIHGSRYRNEGYQEGYGDDREDTNRPDRPRATRYASAGDGRRSEREPNRLHESTPDQRRWGTRGAGPRGFYDYDPLD
jgi:hypothetical protein